MKSRDEKVGEAKLGQRELEEKIHSMESDVSYRCVGEDFDEGVVACGFMRKRTRGRSQIDFQVGYYSGFFLLAGSGLYVTEDGREFPIRAGDFVQRLPGKMHSTYVEPDGEWLEFFVSLGKGRYQAVKKLGLLPEACVSRCPAADILSANPSANLNMEEVAESLSMGYETFRKQFRKRTGLSPADYRLRHKMRQACHMLDAGISIKETAALTGYADVYTFTRQFAKTMGSTPGKYRSRVRNLTVPNNRGL